MQKFQPVDHSTTICAEIFAKYLVQIRTYLFLNFSFSLIKIKIFRCVGDLKCRSSKICQTKRLKSYRNRNSSEDNDNAAAFHFKLRPSFVIDMSKIMYVRFMVTKLLRRHHSDRSIDLFDVLPKYI